MISCIHVSTLPICESFFVSFSFRHQVEADLGRTRNHITQSDARILTLEEQAGQIITELETKATVVALRECVTRRHYEQAVAALGAELELKCTQTTVSSLQSKVTVRDFFYSIVRLFLIASTTVQSADFRGEGEGGS